jgi:feruloyl esterase
MAPGVDHCGGGPGPSGFDMDSALEKWVESNVAPDRIIASKAGMTRPLCPHPQVAKYNGTGNTNDAASFVCAPADATGMP